MEQYIDIAGDKLESCCEDAWKALNSKHEHGIRFKRAFGQARVEVWHSGQYHIAHYCPWCGERFNIIIKDTSHYPTFKMDKDKLGVSKGDYMITMGKSGRGISKSVPKNPSIYVVDHISLFNPEKRDSITKDGQEKLKDIVDLLKKYGTEVFKGQADKEVEP